MGHYKPPPPCVPFVAAFSSDLGLLEATWRRLEAAWGPIADLSDAFDFTESEYYHASMGTGLKKQLALFRDVWDPGELADRKRYCNELESEFATVPEPVRPLNIDPGYVSLTKLVLASTKNREHRIYLRDGVYAEVTLAFRDQVWQPMPWTYADYRRADVHAFLIAARKRFADRLHARRPAQPAILERSDTRRDRT
ncbi:MAG: DUF4416 family protein [Pirellula sp.]|nr:DUF4416 family protein [Pirellula sp.]